jgi:uncharacterized protein
MFNQVKKTQINLISGGIYLSGVWRIFLLFSLIIIIILAACTRNKLIVPPVTSTPTEIYHPGKFVWYDLLTDKVPEVKNFYSTLFGWEYEGDNTENAPYTLIKYKGRAIGGIIYSDLKKDVNESQWISYLSVPDVDRAFEFIGNKGGKQYRKPWDLADRGRVAVVADPQGALFVLFRASGGDPAETQPEFNEWLWTELLTSDPPAVVSFYEELAGFEHEVVEVTEGHQYYVLKKDTRPRAGVVKNPWETVTPNWLPYIRVEDPAILAERVESLGGKVILAPSEDIRNGSVALIADPSGAAVALQRWPME